MPPRRYPETERPASEASGWPEGSPPGIAAAPASFYSKQANWGTTGALWIKSAFPKIYFRGGAQAERRGRRALSTPEPEPDNAGAGSRIFRIVMRRLSIPEWRVFSLGSSAATAGDKTAMEDDTMGAIKELRDITENDVKEAKTATKSTPVKMIHRDRKRLSLLGGQGEAGPREYMFEAIDDFIRGLYAAVVSDKMANDKEFQGNTELHAFAELCRRNGIE